MRSDPVAVHAPVPGSDAWLRLPIAVGLTEALRWWTMTLRPSRYRPPYRLRARVSWLIPGVD